MGRNSTCVTHRELLVPNVTQSTAFATIFACAINPGLVNTFPWLSNIAKQYEMYRFKSLRFVYEPSCSTLVEGRYYFTPDYDASDPDPATEFEAANHSGTVMGLCWRKHTMNFSSRRADLFTHYRTVRSGIMQGDLKTYDCGRFILSAVGGDNGKSTGQLFVEYACELKIPTLGGIGASAHFTSSSTREYSGSPQTVRPGEKTRIIFDPLTKKKDGLRLLDYFLNSSTTSLQFPAAALKACLNGEAACVGGGLNALVSLVKIPTDGPDVPLTTFSLDGVSSVPVNFNFPWFTQLLNGEKLAWDFENLGAFPTDITRIFESMERS